MRRAAKLGKLAEESGIRVCCVCVSIYVLCALYMYQCVVLEWSWSTHDGSGTHHTGTNETTRAGEKKSYTFVCYSICLQAPLLTVICAPPPPPIASQVAQNSSRVLPVPGASARLAISLFTSIRIYFSCNATYKCISLSLFRIRKQVRMGTLLRVSDD